MYLCSYMYCKQAVFLYYFIVYVFLMKGHDHSDERLEEEMPFVVVFLVVGVCKFGCSQLVSLA